MKRTHENASGKNTDETYPKGDTTNFNSPPKPKKKKTKPSGAGKKKVPVTQIRMEKGWGKVGHQKLISEYHTITKKIEATRVDIRISSKEKEEIISELETQLEHMGGLHRYQAASKRGEKLHAGFNTAKWMVKTLTELGLKAKVNKLKVKLRLLDVGALGENYANERAWIECFALDMNSQHPFVHQLDFFDHPCTEPKYDVVCLSLVVNFVGDVKQRGQMLQKARSHLCDGGHMFLVLPLPCVVNSRYMTEEHLLRILAHIGFKMEKKHHSNKLAFYCFSIIQPAEMIEGKVSFPKQELAAGGQRNNFSIVL